MIRTSLPAQDLTELVELGQLRHGVIVSEDLRLLGWPEPSIRRAVACLTKLTRGAYAVEVPLDDLARHRQLCIAVTAIRPGLCLSHLSAGVMWDLPILGPPPIEVQVMSIETRPHGWRAPAGVRHHGQPIDVDRVVDQAGAPVSDVTRTVVDCSRRLSHAEAMVIADAAANRQLTTPARLRADIRTMKGWKGIGRARRMVEDLDDGAESPGETLTRLLVRRVGFRVTSQVEIVSNGRFVARVDLLLDDERVAIEFDGRGKYALNGDPAEALWKEKQRHDALVVAGYEVVRVTWEDLDDPWRVRALIMSAIARSHR